MSSVICSRSPRRCACRRRRAAWCDFAPDDAVALRPLSDTPVRASEIRALEHADAMAWPGVEQHWLDGWLLRAGYRDTYDANSAVPLDKFANQAAIPAIVDWYRSRDLTPRLSVADRLLRLPDEGEGANWVLVRDVHAAEPDRSVRLETEPSAVHLRDIPIDELTAVADGELIFGTHAGNAAGAGLGHRLPRRHSVGRPVDNSVGRTRRGPHTVRGTAGVGSVSRRNPGLHPGPRRRPRRRSPGPVAGVRPAPSRALHHGRGAHVGSQPCG